MIGFYTQIYFASKVTRNLPIGSSQVIKLYPDAFRLGLLGADAFDKIGNVKAEMDSIHGYELFAGTAEYILGSGSKCQLSYMLGMICHYFLDSRMKPYVYYLFEHGVHHYFDDELSVIELEDIENSVDYYIRCSHMLSEMDEIKKTFEDMRQPEKMHTNVLVFYKGDPKHVQDHFQPIEYNEEEAQQLADTFNSVAPSAGEEEQPAEEGGQYEQGTDD